MLTFAIFTTCLLTTTIRAEVSNATNIKDFSVKCDDEEMTIFILKDKITIPESDLNQYNISWNDPDCRPSNNSNETHLVLVAGYSSCGTQAIVEDHDVVFKNTVIFHRCFIIFRVYKK